MLSKRVSMNNKNSSSTVKTLNTRGLLFWWSAMLIRKALLKVKIKKFLKQKLLITVDFFKQNYTYFNKSLFTLHGKSSHPRDPENLRMQGNIK